MIKIDLKAIENSTKYDNNGAYQQLQEMMKRGDRITVSLYSSKDYHACAMIESKKVSKFRYELKNESLTGIFNYLSTGNVSDFDQNPSESELLEEGEDYQMDILKQFIEAGYHVQFVPTFREYNNMISGSLALQKGTIYFRIQRTPENADYVMEYQQVG